jgi:hypothetical protein
MSDIRPGGDAPLHMYAYHALRTTIHDHMQASRVLEESVIPRGGYAAAIARGGTLSEVFKSNAEFRAQVVQSGKVFQPTVMQDAPEGFVHVRDKGLDRG